MLLYAFAFLLGDGLLQSLSTLPYVPGWIALSCMMGLLFSFCKKKWLLILTFLLAGFSYSAWYAENALTQRLSSAFTQKKITVIGTIKTIPNHDNISTHFNLQTHFPFTKTVRLTWRDQPPNLKVGQIWQLHVRLQPPRGTANPGGFDFSAWSLAQGIDAVGYVSSSQSNQLLSERFLLMQYIRQYVYNAITALMPQTSSAHWLPALIVGEKQQIIKDEWRTLRLTGTNHLMAIAGLHIGLLVTIMHFLILFIWRRFALLCLYCPAPIAAACASLAIGISYSLLAGFSLPTQRASIMLSALTLAYLSKRLVSAWHIFAVALFVVLLINPLQILTDSFWLSFTTLTFIFYGMQHRLHPQNMWWKWGRVQWVISVGLLPLSILLFHEISLIAFIANMFAIPWMLFFILPCCFLATATLFIYSPLAHFFLVCADKSVSVLMYVLHWLTTFPFVSCYFAIPTWYVCFSLIGVLLILSPLPFLLRWHGVFWFLPLILYQPAKLAAGEMKVSVLDVGQGLSIVAQTANHVLIYDTGARFQSGGDMGERVVVPFLQHEGIKKIDALVISHDDNDHRGGADSITTIFSPRFIFASRNQKKWASIFCQSDVKWQWDKINFRFLHPTQLTGSKNNDSCVLQISNENSVILIPGDIEKKAEKELIARYKENLKATVLIVPHHGSKTSSTLAFVQMVQPKYAIYSVEFHNHYHLPHPDIKKRYASVAIQQLSTDAMGMIQFDILKENTIIERSYKQENKHYW